MKILYFYLSHRVFGFSSWNIHIYEFMAAVKRLGEDIVPFTPLVVEETADTKIRRVYFKFNRFLPRFSKDILAILHNFATYWRGVKKILQGKPDVVIVRNEAFNFFPLLLKKRLNIPVVLEVNTPIYKERVANGNVSLKMLNFIEKRCWQNVDAITTVSENLKQMLIAEGINEEKITSIHNGVNLEKFDYRISGIKIRAQYNLNDKYLIGFVGGFFPYHGIGDLIKKFNQIVRDWGDVGLFLIGDGIARKQCQQIAESLNLTAHITFTGYVPYDCIPQYISAFDLAIIPDSNDHGSPIKLFEYMAMKKVSLAPSYKPILEIIEHKKTGLVFERHNIDSLIEQIKWARQNQSLIERIAQNAFDRVKEKFTWTVNAQRVINVCKKVVKQ